MDRVLLILGTVLFIQTRVFATVTLQIGPAIVEGNQVIAPIILGTDAGSNVSALNFKLNYNPDALTPVSVRPGIEANNAEKRVLANLTAPGSYTVVMIGMNQTVCRAGEIADVVLERRPGAERSAWALGISDLAVSSPDGSPVEGEAIQPEPDGKETDVTVPDKPAKPHKPDVHDVQEPHTVSEPQTTGDPKDVLMGVPVTRGQAEAGARQTQDVQREVLDSAIKDAAQARQTVAFLDAKAEPQDQETPDVRATRETVSRVMPPAQKGQADAETNKKFKHDSVELTKTTSSAPSNSAASDGKTSGSIQFYALIGAITGAVIAMIIAARRIRKS